MHSDSTQMESSAKELGDQAVPFYESTVCIRVFDVPHSHVSHLGAELAEVQCLIFCQEDCQAKLDSDEVFGVEGGSV